MSATSSHSGDEHHHHRFQAHHFDTTEQQFQAGKLGMWLFLATEVLFFSGMFCAYTVYRVSHPEVFEHAAKFLNPTLGAANTLVLLASSLSVAWGVRCAQLNNQRGLLANLMFTLVCAGIFMGVKSVEYTLKYYEGLLWRGAYSYYTFEEGAHPDLSAAHEGLQTFGLGTLGVGAALLVAGFLFGSGRIGSRWSFYALGATVLAIGAGCLMGNVYTAWEEERQAHGAHAADHADEQHADDQHEDEHPAEDEAAHDEASAEEESAEEESTEATANEEDSNESQPPSDETDSEAATEADTPPIEAPQPAAVEFVEVPTDYGGEGPKFPGVFFSIYYAMTGVHAIHILAGIGVFVWIVSRAARGHFEPEYYGPVEYVGLYWHLVDLIWIYLFPLLYLIQ